MHGRMGSHILVRDACLAIIHGVVHAMMTVRDQTYWAVSLFIATKPIISLGEGQWLAKRCQSNPVSTTHRTRCVAMRRAHRDETKRRQDE